MFKNSAGLEKRHQRFIREVVRSKEIWTLKNEQGYVSSSSNHYDDEDEEPLLLQVFWSTSKEAGICSRNVWKKDNFELESIPLSEFIEFWCVGMHNDFVIVGTNFDNQLYGSEREPLMLAEELLNQLKFEKVEIELESYKDVDHFLTSIKKHIEAEQ